MYAVDTEIIEKSKSTDILKKDLELSNNDGLAYTGPHIDGPKIRYGYKIASNYFMVPESISCEVVQNPQIFSLPKSPKWLHGLINIRGNIEPVMDMNSILGDSRIRNINQRVLVIDKGKASIAVLIDELPVPLPYSDRKTSLDSLPDTIKEFCEPGFIQSDGEWYEFDIQSYFRSLSNSDA